MSKCNHCEEVFVTSAIGNPKGLEKALRIIRGCLADGTIVKSDFWPEGTLKSCTTPFEEVNGNGPYTEDIFEYYFECPKCHQIFRLLCNAYHGSGGAWEPLDERYL